MQFNEALQRICRIRARLGNLRENGQTVPAILDKTLSEVTSELSAIEEVLERQSSADRSKQLFLEKIINSFTDPLFIKDRQHRYLLINAAESKLAGRTPDEMIGKTCYDFFPKEQAAIFWETDESVFDTGMESIDEEYVTDSRGIVRTMLTKKTLYVDEEGNQFLVGIARDITEIKKVEEQLKSAYDRLEKRVFQRTEDLERANKALRDTRDSLDMIINSIGDPIHVKDRHHRVILVNDAACKLFNRKKENILGRTAFDLFTSPEDAAVSWQKDEEVFSTWVENVNEETNTYAQGVTRTVLIKKTPYRDKSGNEFLVGVTRDITDRKLAEEALRESERKYSLLINNASEAIIVAQDGLLKFVNPMTVNLLEVHSERDLINRPFPGFIHPDDRKMVVENYQRRIAKQGAPARYAFRVITSEGIVKWVEINATLIDWQGRPATLNFLTDITERKRAEESLGESEQRLLDIIDFLPDATFVIDRNGKVIAWNKAIEAMTGILAKDMIGKDDYEYSLPFYGIRRPILIDLILKSDKDLESSYSQIERKGQALVGESYMPNMQGGVAYLLGSAAVLYDSAGNVFGAIESIRDITEKKQAENRLIDSKEAAEAAARSKSDFLANMSHEIRTPLNAVLGLTGLLLNSDLNSQERDYVETVRSSGNTLLSVINDILDFSKIEGGKMELESQPFQLRECISVAVDLIMPSAAQKGLAVKYDLDESLPSYFKGDVTRLRQVLVNLLGNAVKFTQEGTIGLSVMGRPLEAQDGSDGRQYELHFSISDTGIGIPEEKLDRLFRSFSQVDSTTTRKYGGTGLGLAISRKLVEMMGGEIWVVSEPNVGSTFHFTIRTEVSEEESSPSVPELVVPIVHRQDGVRPLRILLAEDNAVNQMVAKQMLKMLGYSADVAGNGLEVLQALERQPYDVILMDVQMPEMDGLAASQEIRKRWPKGPRIVAITAYALKGDRERCLAAGMDEYISKPIVIEELKRVLERCESAPEKRTIVQLPGLGNTNAP
jgi:PAS domain S-box-containing protein